jgi:hypothetical protein
MKKTIHNNWLEKPFIIGVWGIREIIVKDNA